MADELERNPAYVSSERAWGSCYSTSSSTAAADPTAAATPASSPAPPKNRCPPIALQVLHGNTNIFTKQSSRFACPFSHSHKKSKYVESTEERTEKPVPYFSKLTFVNFWGVLVMAWLKIRQPCALSLTKNKQEMVRPLPLFAVHG